MTPREQREKLKGNHRFSLPSQHAIFPLTRPKTFVFNTVCPMCHQHRSSKTHRQHMKGSA